MYAKYEEQSCYKTIDMKTKKTINMKREVLVDAQRFSCSGSSYINLLGFAI